ncbi:MAG: GNAT family N-acetyltransferase [Syntrophobacteraceae bacterium]
MIDAQNYNAPEKLKNGAAVTVRAIRPDDRNRIVAAFKNLDRESIYTRFFRYKHELTDTELKTITDVDFEETVALVVTMVAAGGDETIIGAGRYVQYGPPNPSRSAEIAFTVEEDYQGQGIASMILRHLVHVAGEKGLQQFEAEVLPENSSMLTVLARSGLPLKQTFGDGAVHVTLSLAAEGSEKTDK